MISSLDTIETSQQAIFSYLRARQNDSLPQVF